MSLFAKIMVVVNFILAVAFLAAAGTLLGAAEDYKAKYEKYQKDSAAELASKEAQIDARENKLKELTTRYGDVDKERATKDALLRNLDAQNSSLAAQNTQLRADYDKLAAAQQDLQTRISDLNRTIDARTSELATSEAARKDAEAKGKAGSDEIARLNQDKETAERSLASAQAAHKQISDQLEENRVTLERYRKEKGQLTGGVAMKDIKAVVQAAKNDVDIYILSVGSKDGVEAGYEFTVYRGPEYVSTIVVDKVFPNYSSATTKRGTKKRDVMAGDEAATRL